METTGRLPLGPDRAEWDCGPRARRSSAHGDDTGSAGGAALNLPAALVDIHMAWAWVVIIGNGLAGAWALAAHRLPALRTRALWWFTALVEAAVFVQVGLGVGMVAGQGLVAPEFHMFYGFVAIIAVGILYSYRQQMRHRLHLLYGFGGLFVMGLGIRALLVGQA